MKIESLFDESRDLHRAIEKVITFGADKEDRIGSEIREYIVTPHVEAEIEDVLTKMQIAMEDGGPNEVGVWVSGFYGSGKSSFTKYLGLALDDSREVDGQPFLKHLQDRVKKVTTKQLLSKVAKAYPAAVVFLDLASDMLSGTTRDVSTVLFYKVLEYAGYSRNLKVAAFERRMKKDGRYNDFCQIIRDDYELDWETDFQNDMIMVEAIVPEVAHKLYPQLFKTPTSFNTEDSEIVQFESDRVKEMLDIVREKSGKEYVIFVLDEVGQYVASSGDLILRLQGLAENLKTLGDGKAWFFATAQQMLTEDDEKAAINSPELFKLKDRFPISVDLPATDIRQICYERLLIKSESGKQELTNLFNDHGEKLRQHTKLENAKFYSAELDTKTFIDLYPFLPAHFDILLQLLGVLAKSTGGIGLRSAIKVIQDILIEGPHGQSPVCDKPVGWLANMVTLFDALEKDIERSSKTIYSAYQKIGIQFPGSATHQDIGKTVAALQILNNIQVTRQNVASLMHADIKSPSSAAAIEAAIEELINEPKVPFDERDGSLCFLSERLSDIQKVRGEIPPRTVDMRRTFNEALSNLFQPLPSRKLLDSLTVTAGLKSRSGQLENALAGERSPVQFIAEFVAGDDFEAVQTRTVDDSRSNSNRNNIYVLGKQSEESDKLVTEIFRCHEIANRYKNDPEDEVRDYCKSQEDRAVTLLRKLEDKLARSLLDGVFIFRADKTAVDSRGQRLDEACKKFLGDEVAGRVFDKYQQAAVRVESNVAEQFLKTDNLGSVTAKQDPLSLVKKNSAGFEIDLNHPAIGSIRDHLKTHGKLDGKQLEAKFKSDPFGWSPDTIRYLIAAMLRASELKLKIAGKEITAVGQQAIEGLRNNNPFKKVIVELRDSRPSNENLASASQRLTQLTGEQVVPLEEDICKATAKYFAQIQTDYGALAEKLKSLNLEGGEQLESICGSITDSLQGDCSGAVNEIGAEASEVFAGLAKASEIRKAFDNGIGDTIQQLKSAINDIQSLPESGIPGQLRSETQETIQQLQTRLSAPDFYEHAAEYATAVTSLESAVAESTKAMLSDQQKSVSTAKSTLQNLPQWKELTHNEQSEMQGKLDDHLVEVQPSMVGLKTLLNNEYALNSQTRDASQKVTELGKDRINERLLLQKEQNEGAAALQETLTLPAALRSEDDFKTLRDAVDEAQQKSQAFDEFEFTIELDQ